MKKGNKEPNPMVQLSVQDITRESKVYLQGKVIVILKIVFRLFLYKSHLFSPLDLLHNH